MGPPPSPLVSPRGALMGAISVRLGAGLERRLEALHLVYLAQRRANVRPRPARAHLRRGREAVLGRLESVGADYAGVLAGGRAVALDAKSLPGAARRLSVGTLVRSRPEQVADLVATARLGGVAFFYVERRPPGGAHDVLVPVTGAERWRAVLAGEVASVPLDGEGAAEWEVLALPAGCSDWLATLVRAGRVDDETTRRPR